MLKDQLRAQRFLTEAQFPNTTSYNNARTWLLTLLATFPYLTAKLPPSQERVIADLRAEVEKEPMGELRKEVRSFFARQDMAWPIVDSSSLGEVIRDHVYSLLDQFITERESAPDRDRTVAILPSGPVLPLESEVIIRELPSNEFRFPPDPFYPSAPVGPWVSSLAGKMVGIVIAVCLALELVTMLYFRGEFLQGAGGLLITVPALGWFLSNWRDRRRFERQTPHSVTYHRPQARSVGPYFVWTFADPADPDDPHSRAKQGDPRAVGVELKQR